jgi:hypothetical protein
VTTRLCSTTSAGRQDDRFLTFESPPFIVLLTLSPGFSALFAAGGDLFFVKFCGDVIVFHRPAS